MHNDFHNDMHNDLHNDLNNDLHNDLHNDLNNELHNDWKITCIVDSIITCILPCIMSCQISNKWYINKCNTTKFKSLLHLNIDVSKRILSAVFLISVLEIPQGKYCCKDDDYYWTEFLYKLLFTIRKSKWTFLVDK